MIVSKSLTWLDSPTLITFEWVLFHVSGSQTHMTWLVFLNSIFKCFVLKRTCWVLYYQNRISVTLTNSPHWLKIEFDEKTEYVVVFFVVVHSSSVILIGFYPNETHTTPTKRMSIIRIITNATYCLHNAFHFTFGLCKPFLVVFFSAIVSAK